MSGSSFMKFLLKITRKDFFHIQFKEMMSEVCKTQTNDLKTLLYVLTGSSQISGVCSEAKMYPRLISNSGKRKINKKNSFVNLFK